MARPNKSGYRVFRRKVLTKKWVNSSGIPEFVKKMNAMGESVESEEIFEALMKGAFRLRDNAKARAPYQSVRAHPEGWLHIRDVIFAARGKPEKDRKGPTVIAGVNARKAPQAFWIEKGTYKMAARPFWRPAVAQSRPQIAAQLREDLQTILIATAQAKAFGG